MKIFLSLQIISLVSSVASVIPMLFIYTVKSVVKEYCGILSGGILSGSQCTIAKNYLT